MAPMTTNANDSYLRIRNTKLEMRRSLRKRISGEIEIGSGGVIRWDTKERRVTLEGSDVMDHDLVEAVHGVAQEAQFTTFHQIAVGHS